MYQIKNKTYADAGYVLKYKNKVAFSFEGVDINNVLETKINLENIQKIGNFVIYDDLKDKITTADFAKLKSKFVNKQFTNDDQIAIMLNKDESDEDAFLFSKMQEWRVWAGMIAKEITRILQ